MISKKAPHQVDVYVGQRVRVRRNELGISQEKLGEALGLTFQQVQKYEKGSNRISCSRLYQIAEYLNAPLTFFFEGLGPTGTATGSDLTTRFMSLPGAVKLAREFTEANAVTRSGMVSVVETIGAIAARKE